MGFLGREVAEDGRQFSPHDFAHGMEGPRSHVLPSMDVVAPGARAGQQLPSHSHKLRMPPLTEGGEITFPAVHRPAEARHAIGNSTADPGAPPPAISSTRRPQSVSAASFSGSIP